MKRRIFHLFPFLVFLSSFSWGKLQLGRFSQVLAQKEGYIWNLHYAVYVERGFKVFAILPKREREQFGKSLYAGFFTLLIDDEYLFTQFSDPKDGTEVVSNEDNHLVVAKSVSNASYSIKTFCEVWLGYPYIRFWAEVEPKKELKIQYVLTGYPWANMNAPPRWKLPSEEEREIKEGYILSPGREIQKGYVLFRPQEPVTFTFFFTQFPRSIYKNKSEIRIAFSDSLAPGKKYTLPPLYYAVLPSPLERIKEEDLEKLGQSCCSPPQSIETIYGRDDKGPFISYQLTFREEPREVNLPSLHLIAVPPTLSNLYKPSLVVPSLLGDVGYVEGENLQIPLPIPPNFHILTENFPPLPKEWQQLVEKHLQDILAHQQPDGTFTFSRGRPFYDGLTISALVQLYPILSLPLKERVASAVRKNLDYWWGRLTEDERTGVYWFPEPPPSFPQVDYPEITSTLLYPTAAYGKLVDKKYITSIIDKAELLLRSLPSAYDWTGSAYAFPGPDYLHIMTESTVGGYLAYASLYHIFEMAGRKDILPQLEARSAMAFQAMALYHHKPVYEDPEIVSEIRWDSLKTKIEIPWDYTMYTWFSFIPLWWLPQEDVYNLWNVLDREKWWKYYERSPQRAYDYADLIAIHRFKKGDWRKYLGEFADKPFAYDYFDATPVYAVIAYPWLVTK